MGLLLTILPLVLCGLVLLRPAPWNHKLWGIICLHLVRVVVCGFFLVPVAVSFTIVLRMPALPLPAAAAAGLLLGWWTASRAVLPPKTWQRYGLPALLSWVLFFGFIPAIFMVNFGEGTWADAFVPNLYIMGYLAAFVGCERRRSDRVPLRRWAWATMLCFYAVSIGHIALVSWQEHTYHALRGHGFERLGGFSSSDLKPYDPRNPQNILPKLKVPASFRLQKEPLPVLDGAEAAFPVYAAFAQACYNNLTPLTKDELARYDSTRHVTGPITFTNTVYAFGRLLKGEADIIFGAHPSQEQMQQAAQQGKTLLLSPIGKEAFVFFVNAQNPVNSLNVEQLQGIYGGKFNNWKQVGGTDTAIMAFQRPRNSGSQTIMLRFMGNTPMQAPLEDRVVAPMGGAVERVSEYRNAPAALGYSFRYFLSGMGQKSRIKMLALNGVDPTQANIRSGRYPYVVNLYAITLKKPSNPHVLPFIEWMQGPEGQELLEKVGYVSLK